MIDRLEQAARMTGVEREDRALLRSNPSARSMPGQGQAFGSDAGRLSPLHCSGPNAINLPWLGTEPFPSAIRRGVTYVKIFGADPARAKSSPNQLQPKQEHGVHE